MDLYDITNEEMEMIANAVKARGNHFYILSIKNRNNETLSNADFAIANRYRDLEEKLSKNLPEEKPINNVGRAGA